MKTARLVSCVIFLAWMLSASLGPAAAVAAPSGGVSGAARLEAMDGGRDLVGPNQALRASGKNDALFRLEISAPGRTITGIELKDSAGRRAVWDTFPHNRTWLLAVSRGGRLLNRPDGSLRVPLGQGRETFDLWVEDNGAVKGGGTDFLLTVFFADGVRVSFPVAAGSAGQAGGVSAGAAGYLVEVTAQDIFIDRGTKHGVRAQDRFTVLDGRGRSLATLVVRKAYPDVSLVTLAKGRRGALAPGQRVVRALAGKSLLPSALEPAATPPSPPAPLRQAAAPAGPTPAGGTMKVGVLPVTMDTRGSLIDITPAALPAGAVAKGLNVYRPLTARALSPDELRQLEQAEGAALDSVMERLGLDAIVRWGVSQEEYEERATMFVAVVRRGQAGEQESASLMVDADLVPRRFARLVTRLVGESLGYI